MNRSANTNDVVNNDVTNYKPTGVYCVIITPQSYNGNK